MITEERELEVKTVFEFVLQVAAIPSVALPIILSTELTMGMTTLIETDQEV